MDIADFTEKQIERFWSKVDRGDPDDCWPWLGWCNHSGHGRFDLGPVKIVASRAALILSGFPEPAPPANFALHGDSCTPSCCNPNHVRWGTPLENTRDRDRLGRRICDVGEAHCNSTLTEDIVRMIRASDLGNRPLGRQLGLSGTHVRFIRQRKLWKHVT